jgi:hypothetical protein
MLNQPIGGDPRSRALQSSIRASTGFPSAIADTRQAACTRRAIRTSALARHARRRAADPPRANAIRSFARFGVEESGAQGGRPNTSAKNYGSGPAFTPADGVSELVVTVEGN